jgi:hypothetical protein
MVKGCLASTLRAPRAGSRTWRVARGLALVGVAVAPAALFACGLTADFGGLQGGTPDAASSPPPPPSSSCASRTPAPTFCDDFDHASLPGAWDVFHQIGGSLAIESSASVSPPSSLVVIFSALDPGQLLDTALRKRFALPPSRGTTALELAVRPVTADPTPGAVVVLFSLDFFDAANNRYSLQFALRQTPGGLSVTLGEQSGFIDGGMAYVEHPLPDPLTLGTWTKVRIEVARTAPRSATARVTFDGRVELDSVPLSVTVDAAALLVSIGSTFESLPSKPWSIRYDDVVIDLAP